MLQRPQPHHQRQHRGLPEKPRKLVQMVRLQRLLLRPKDFNRLRFNHQRTMTREEGVMPPLQAIAQLFKMEDFSGTLGELHGYFAEALTKEQEPQQAATIAKTLRELSSYILSWEYAEDTYEKPFLESCKKLIDGKTPKQKIENFDQEQVKTFFEQALSLEPELAEKIKQIQEEPNEDFEE